MEYFDLLIKNATICTMDVDKNVIQCGYVAVKGTNIARISEGPAPENINASKTIDASGQVLFPGFNDTHTHIFQSSLKGLGADHRLIEWLNRSALPYGALMTPYQHRLAAQLTCMEAIRSGCTTLCEFFYTGQNPDLADGYIAGVKDTGIRSVFIRTFQDRGEDYGMPACMIQPADKAMEEVSRLRREYVDRGDMLSIWTGMDFSAVSSASWLSLPQPFRFGMPQFNLEACVLMAVVYLFVLLDTTGTWFTVQAVTGEPMEDERVDRGTIGEGFGCLAGAFFGGTPMTGYSSNAGLIAITKVASRRVVIAGGAILVLLGFCPKLMTVITSLPTPVINGVFAMVCMTLISNGVKMIKDTVMDDRATMILGVSVMCGVSTMILPDEVVQAAPQFIQYFLSSGIAVGGTVAILLQLFLPKLQHSCVKGSKEKTATA